MLLLLLVLMDGRAEAMEHIGALESIKSVRMAAESMSGIEFNILKDKATVLGPSLRAETRPWIPLSNATVVEATLSHNDLCWIADNNYMNQIKGLGLSQNGSDALRNRWLHEYCPKDWKKKGSQYRQFVTSVTLRNNKECIGQLRWDKTLHGDTKSPLIDALRQLHGQRRAIVISGDSASMALGLAAKAEILRFGGRCLLGTSQKTKQNRTIDGKDEPSCMVQDTLLHPGPLAQDAEGNLLSMPHVLKFVAERSVNISIPFLDAKLRPLQEYMPGGIILIFNMGLRYNNFQNHMHPLSRQHLHDHAEQVIAWMVNFTSRNEGNVAVWRETTFQHFDGPMGYYMGSFKGHARTCQALSGKFDHSVDWRNSEISDLLISHGARAIFLMPCTRGTIPNHDQHLGSFHKDCKGNCDCTHYCDNGIFYRPVWESIAHIVASTGSEYKINRSMSRMDPTTIAPTVHPVANPGPEHGLSTPRINITVHPNQTQMGIGAMLERSLETLPFTVQEAMASSFIKAGFLFEMPKRITMKNAKRWASWADKEEALSDIAEAQMKAGFSADDAAEIRRTSYVLGSVARRGPGHS